MTRKKTNEEYDAELTNKELGWIRVDNYINTDTKILHSCFEGHEILIKPNHVLGGTKCSKCSSISKTKTTCEYKAELVLKGIDITPVEPYINTKTKIKHRCNIGHEWNIQPQYILIGKGCPYCNTGGFNYNKPGYLYFVSFTILGDETLYKIGITNNSDISKRFGSDWNKFKFNIEWVECFESGKDAYEQEQYLLSYYKELKINSGFLISGNTETFSECIKEELIIKPNFRSKGH